MKLIGPMGIAPIFTMFGFLVLLLPLRIGIEGFIFYPVACGGFYFAYRLVHDTLEYLRQHPQQAYHQKLLL